MTNQVTKQTVGASKNETTTETQIRRPQQDNNRIQTDRCSTNIYQISNPDVYVMLLIFKSIQI